MQELAKFWKGVWLWRISGGYSESDDVDARTNSISVWRGCWLTSS